MRQSERFLSRACGQHAEGTALGEVKSPELPSLSQPPQLHRELFSRNHRWSPHLLFFYSRWSFWHHGQSWRCSSQLGGPLYLPRRRSSLPQAELCRGGSLPPAEDGGAHRALLPATAGGAAGPLAAGLGAGVQDTAQPEPPPPASSWASASLSGGRRWDQGTNTTRKERPTPLNSRLTPPSRGAQTAAGRSLTPAEGRGANAEAPNPAPGNGRQRPAPP